MSHINKECLFAYIVLIIMWSNLTVLNAQSSTEAESKDRLFYDASDWCNQNIPVDYWLSQKQISGLLYIKSSYDGILLPEIEKLDSIYNKPLDEQSESYKIEIQRLEDKIFELRIEARIEIRKILGISKSKYFDDFVFSQWWSYQKKS